MEAVSNQLRTNLGIESISFKSLEFAEYLELLDQEKVTGPFRLGIAAGVLAALRRKSLLDSLVLVTTTAIVSIPTFVLGFSLRLLLGVKLGWFPIAGLADGARSYLLPGFVLGALAGLRRPADPYVAGGEPALRLRADGHRQGSQPKTCRRHPCPVDLGALMGGAIVTEGIFNLPGVGQQVFLSVRAQEGPVVVGHDAS
jgi:peptide/nickel transport system permease protein/oligopeptide transport system permease protein